MELTSGLSPTGDLSGQGAFPLVSLERRSDSGAVPRPWFRALQAWTGIEKHSDGGRPAYVMPWAGGPIALAAGCFAAATETLRHQLSCRWCQPWDLAGEAHPPALPPAPAI